MDFIIQYVEQPGKKEGGPAYTQHHFNMFAGECVGDSIYIYQYHVFANVHQG